MLLFFFSEARENNKLENHHHTWGDLLTTNTQAVVDKYKHNMNIRYTAKVLQLTLLPSGVVFNKLNNF